MGVRNRSRERLSRLSHKTLEARFLGEVREGLGCSPFEAEAVLGVVREVYGPYLAESAAEAPPGRVTLVVVSADEPAGKPVEACAKQTVSVLAHGGAGDDELLERAGPQGFRRAKILDLCQEALSQGGLLTREDLAYRVFFVSPRTISRDLKFLRESDPGVVLPIRSLVHDIGPVLTHRTEIVRLALEGKTTTEICRILRHSPSAVGNYLSTFVRCVQLAERGMQVGQISFLLRRGPGLVRQYLQLYEQVRSDANWQYHLDELMQLGSGSWGEKEAERPRHG